MHLQHYSNDLRSRESSLLTELEKIVHEFHLLCLSSLMAILWSISWVLKSLKQICRNYFVFNQWEVWVH
jgi:hypothetical protein